MGATRGRPAKPAAMKVLAGNPGRRPIKAGPNYELASVAAPDFLKDIALAEWNRVAPQLHINGVLEKVGVAGLAAYCEVYARWRLAEEGIAKVGLMVKGSTGNVVQNPLVRIASESLNIMHKYMREYGMTPSSKQGVGDGGNGDSKNEFAGFFN